MTRNPTQFVDEPLPLGDVRKEPERQHHVKAVCFDRHIQQASHDVGVVVAPHKFIKTPTADDAAAQNCDFMPRGNQWACQLCVSPANVKHLARPWAGQEPVDGFPLLPQKVVAHRTRESCGIVVRGTGDIGTIRSHSARSRFIAWIQNRSVFKSPAHMSSICNGPKKNVCVSQHFMTAMREFPAQSNAPA